MSREHQKLSASFLVVSSVFEKRKTRLRAITSPNGPWKRTFSVDEKDAGMGEREKWDFAFPMIPSTKPIIAPVALESLSNPLEYDWVRGRYLVVQNNLGRKKKERRKAQSLYLC